MEKTYSQKIARVFEIICYVLLLPTCFSLIYPALMLIGGLASGRPDVLLFGLIPLLIIAPGLVLLIGYSKHARGTLSEKFVSALWIGTAVYNFLLLLPCLYYAAGLLQSSGDYYGETAAGFSPEFFFPLVFILGYIFAIVFALKANSFEKRKNYSKNSSARGYKYI